MFKRAKIKKGKISVLALDKLHDKKVFYCCLEDKHKSSLFLASKSGTSFKKELEINVFSENGNPEQLKKCENFRFFRSGKDLYLTFSRQYSKFFLSKRKQTVVAKAHSAVCFDVIDREDNWELEAFTSVSRHSHKNNFLAYFGGKSIRVAASNNLRNWHLSGDLISSRDGYFDKDPLHVIDALVTKRGILVLYKSYKKGKGNSRIKIGGALFSLDKPYKLLWRSEKPLLEKVLPKGSRALKYIGCFADRDVLELHWVTKRNKLITGKIKTVTKGVGSLKKRPVHLVRHESNPIIRPKAENYWEYDATFNPAAIQLGDKTHLIYRAIGRNSVSVFGYASSNDGLTINERLDAPAFAAADFSRYSKEDQALYPSKYVSGGSWIGCEDPRITKIEDRIYMTYTSFDGWNPPGVAMTWISVKDFLRKNWTWKRPVLISRSGQIQKNWMLFPEKINGKYAILHSITPTISIEYVDDLDKEGLVFDSHKKPGKDEKRWDNIMRGAGAPPIRTKYGWLLLYHAMDKKDPNRYKVGAMVLDFNDPSKIIHRADCPILEPDASYENDGYKAGVVYVCGAVIKDETLFVYYGGADSVVCVATADIDEFLKDTACSVANDPATRKKAIRNVKIKKKKSVNKSSKKIKK
jgi:predicted GH43/DUF377 family glycosyl hydrolase